MNGGAISKNIENITLSHIIIIITDKTDASTKHNEMSRNCNAVKQSPKLHLSDILSDISVTASLGIEKNTFGIFRCFSELLRKWRVTADTDARHVMLSS